MMTSDTDGHFCCLKPF